MNATIEKFGYPDTLLHEYENWAVLLRPEQVTIGSMVLANTSERHALSELETDAFTELAQVTEDLEQTLRTTFNHDKINYLLLMMVDPHVHFHVLPRYGAAREFGGETFADASWPGPPNLSSAIDLPDELRRKLRDHMRSHWGQ